LFFILIAYSCDSKKRKKSGANEIQIKSEELKIKADSMYYADHFQDALLMYDSLLANDSLDGELYFKKAYCLLQIDRYRESNMNYSKALNLNYRSEDCLYNMAITCSLILLDDSTALEYLEKGLIINPDSKKIKELKREIEEK
jgi:tetratricopeptide (TPR) repeat protein